VLVPHLSVDSIQTSPSWSRPWPTPSPRSSNCERYDVDLDELRLASGFTFIALRDSAVEALLADEEVRTEFLAAARQARKLFKAMLPDPAAADHQSTVAVIRVLAERIVDVARPERADLEAVTDAVDDLLDRSVGAEEYVIRAAAEGIEPDPLIDLSKIDFDALSARFAGRKRAETDRLATLLKRRAVSAARRNEDMTEEELAVFDLLTKPQPVLDEDERAVVKASAKRLLAPPARQACPRLAAQRLQLPPRCERPSATSWTPTCPPTRTRPSCSMPRSRRCSTTSSAPTATTVPACTPVTMWPLVQRAGRPWRC